jgi:glycerate kinase
MPHLLAAPDKFRGTASAVDVATTMCAAAEQQGWTVRAQPLSDGGDGLLEVFAGQDFEVKRTRVHGPLGGEVEAEWRCDGNLAVLEMARASGLTLAGGPAHNDAVGASSVGTGELIVAAADAVGSDGRIVVGLGGSATTDGGWEAARVVRDAGGLRGTELIGACDVRIGFVDAARLFGPQKGATEQQVAELGERLARVAGDYLREFGVDVTAVEGAGAAGGFGGAVAALGGELRSGYELVAEFVALRQAIAGADLVLTGEGALDAPSFMGKVVGGVVDDSTAEGVPVVVVAGRATEEARAEAARRGVGVVSLLDRFGRAAAMADPRACIAVVVGELLADPEAVRG